MIFNVDPAGPVPIYRQIVDQAIYRIAEGELTHGDQLPSIRSLSLELRVNPNTVIKAYRELEHSGFAASRHGKGYFVSGNSVDPVQSSWQGPLLATLRQSVIKAVSTGVRPEIIRAAVEQAIRKGGRQ